MSLASAVNNPAIDSLVESSLESKEEHLRFEWISYEEITNIKPTPTDTIYYASHKQQNGDRVYETMIMLLLLGNSKECTPTLVSEFARTYSLPTHKYDNDNSQFKRYDIWLKERNKLIKGFTEYEDNYYMVADKRFYRCYFRYGLCTACT